jgi:hypothetical protein
MGVQLGLTLWEELRLREFENKILRGIFGSRIKSGEATGGIKRNFIICPLRQILL